MQSLQTNDSESPVSKVIDVMRVRTVAVQASTLTAVSLEATITSQWNSLNAYCRCSYLVGRSHALTGPFAS